MLCNTAKCPELKHLLKHNKRSKSNDHSNNYSVTERTSKISQGQFHWMGSSYSSQHMNQIKHEKEKQMWMSKQMCVYGTHIHTNAQLTKLTCE